MGRLRRSLLYVPANNARALEKARTLPCDGIIFDLEDAVAPQDKPAARTSVLEALGADYGHRELVVRINALDSEWGEDDLRALMISRADAILLPKVNRPDDIIRAEHILLHNKPIWAMMETARSVVHAGAIAASSQQLQCMVMGLNDLAKELKVAQTPDRLALLYSLSACVVAARAYGRNVIDAVYGDIKDEAGFAASCQQGRALGFDGKTVIHPGQIEAANRVFAPQPEEVELAQKIIAAWDSAPNKGVITLDGRMIEALHVDEARQTLAAHAAIAARENKS